MKTLYKSASILALLGGLVFATQAQVLIGSFQGASDPLNSGWINVNTGNPITSDTNCSFPSGVVTGYAQSLDISAVGQEGNFGYPSLQLQFSPAQIAAFNTNSWVTFTFSVPAWTNGGYSQIYNFALNAPGYGYNNLSWTNALEMGDTNATTPGSDPNFYFYNGSPVQTMVVTINYSSVTNAIIAGGESSLQMTFQGNQGGGAPTDWYINSVVLSQYPFGEASPPGNDIIIDQFNPTNNPYAGTNIYAATDNEITNVYNLWAGYGGNTAVNPDNGDLLWDSTQDADGNTNSGSLELFAHMTNSNQYLVWDLGPNNTFALNPPITNGYGLLTFEFDVKYDPSSPTTTSTGTTTNYGLLEVGPVPPYSGLEFGTYNYYVTNTGWMHVVLPVNAKADPTDLLSITGLYFKQYAYGMIGTTHLWIDNLKFTFTNLPPVIPPPTVTIQQPSPGLRLFTGGGDQYGRTELVTRQSESWVNSTPGSPATYSFIVKSIPSTMAQTHLFLIPFSGIPDTTYNGQDYNASDGLWLTIGPTGIAQVSWKTNYPGHNAFDQNIALRMTNTPVVGKWTLSFTGPNNGTVTGPGGTPVPFTITDTNVMADFADPVNAYFGCQANSSTAIGNYEDWVSVSITNTASPISEDFTAEPNRSVSGIWVTLYEPPADAGADIVVSTNDMPAYWVSWTLPAVNFDIASKTNLLQSGPWISPQYWDDYMDNTAPYGAAQQFGQNMWVLEPKDDLPTANGMPFGPLSPNAFFLVSTNVSFP